jgi:hypothetical protein
MQLLYGEGFNEAERDFRRHVVHENLIRGFQNLFEEMEERQAYSEDKTFMVR